MSDQLRHEAARALRTTGGIAQDVATTEALAGDHYAAALWRTISSLATLGAAALLGEPLPDLPVIPDPPARLPFGDEPDP